MDPSMEQHEPTTWEQIGDHKSQSYPSRHTGVEEKEIQNFRLESRIKKILKPHISNSRAMKHAHLHGNMRLIACRVT
jgi:hypothetical protein